MPAMKDRRLPIGAELLPDGGGVHFRVWAPKRKAVRVEFASGGANALPLADEGDGHFSGVAPHAKAGTLYGFRLDADDKLYPDPASRFQPEGPHAPSEIVDPRAFGWSDQTWSGATMAGQVVYEMHVGTFTSAGTFAAAVEQLPELARIGITMIEVMPLAEFDGRFGWGYDGVDLYAPSH